MSTLLEPDNRAREVMSGGGAVPGFFLRPFKFAWTAVVFMRTSQVGGNSIGHGIGFVLNVLKPA